MVDKIKKLRVWMLENLEEMRKLIEAEAILGPSDELKYEYQWYENDNKRLKYLIDLFSQHA